MTLTEIIPKKIKLERYPSCTDFELYVAQEQPETIQIVINVPQIYIDSLLKED